MHECSAWSTARYSQVVWVLVTNQRRRPRRARPSQSDDIMLPPHTPTHWMDNSLMQDICIQAVMASVQVEAIGEDQLSSLQERAPPTCCILWKSVCTKMRVTLAKFRCRQRRRSQNVTKQPVIDGCGDTRYVSCRGSRGQCRHDYNNRRDVIIIIQLSGVYRLGIHLSDRVASILHATDSRITANCHTVIKIGLTRDCQVLHGTVTIVQINC